MSRHPRRARIDAIEFEPSVEFRSNRCVALDGLRVVVELRQTLDLVEGSLAALAYAGVATWTDIGAALGISRQAAFMRHRDRVKKTDGDSPRPFV